MRSLLIPILVIGPVAAGTASAGCASLLGIDGDYRDRADAGLTDAGPTCGGGTASANAVVVTPTTTYQTISGFGASTAWWSTMSASDADLLWSTTAGAGLSLHRVRIDPTTGQTTEVSIAKLAVAHGVKVWATAWSPPNADKSNGNVAGGNVTNEPAFATYLMAFVTYMHGQGVPIYAVSPQNEPDVTTPYESCSYTAASLVSFIGTYMGPTFANSGVKVIAPETHSWCTLSSYESAFVSDTTAWNYVSILGTHGYACSPVAYPEIQDAGKEFWATESYDQVTAEDPGIASGLRVAQSIHDDLTLANMNAWHYWWVYPAGTDNAALWDKTTGQASKRLWVEGNYARFVRPGFVRVSTAGAPANLSVSAYKNPLDGRLVIVAINNTTSTVPVTFFVSGTTPCTFIPWLTSASDSLAEQPAIAVRESQFSATLQDQSVTTFVGAP